MTSNFWVSSDGRLMTHVLQKNIIFLFLKLSLAFLTFIYVPSQAQPQGKKGPPKPKEGWQFTLGAALIYSPLYEGDDEQGLNLVPDLRARYGDLVFLSLPEGFGLRIRPTEWLEIAPLIKYRFRRNESDGPSPFQVSGETTDLEGLGDVEGATEAGGYIQLRFRPITFKFEYRQGRGGHEGQIANSSLSYGSRLGPIIYNWSLNADWASEEYFNAYFGVDNIQSAASGLDPYQVEDSGLTSLGTSLFLMTPIFYPMTVVTIFSYRRLQSRIADSSLVSTRGARDQLTAIISLSWSL